MAWFLTYFLLYVGTTVVSALLAKTQRVENDPGKPQFPKADPNAPIPIVYGKCRVGMNVIHKARMTFGENTVRGSTPFGWSPQHIGYFYYGDIQAVLCWGNVQALWDVIVDGSISLADAGPARIPFLDAFGVSYTTAPALSFTGAPLVQNQAILTITAGDILGGKFGRGGIGAGGDAGSTGKLTIQGGSGYPYHNTDFEAAAAEDIPIYPYLCLATFSPSFYFGNSESLPSIEFVISRGATALGGTGYLGNTTANGGQDAVAGAVLYDLLTNPLYGMGLPAAEIDASTFNAVSNCCDASFGGAFDFGLSFAVTEQVTAKELLADLLRTLDGVIYTHPTTGLLSARLLRQPDDGFFGIGGAPTISESQIVDGSFEWSESAADATVNEVRVEFLDKARQFTTNVATVRNVAAIQALGRVESRTVRFLGVTNADLATRLAQRELRALSTSLGHATFEVDRSGYVYTPGQFFYLTYGPRGFASKVMRVVSVRDTPSGKVAIDAVEDVYSSSTVSYTAVSPTEPAPPAGQPFIAPYVVEEASQTSTVGTLTLFVYDPSGVVTSVEFQTTSGTGTPSGFGTDAYPYSATVTLDPYATSAIDYRVNYTDAQGDAQTLLGSVTFGVDSDTAAEVGGAVGEIVGALGEIGIPIPFYSSPLGTSQWLAMSTIPATAEEMGSEYRRRVYDVGGGRIRVHAHVKAKTGTPTLSVKSSSDDYATTPTDCVSLSITGTGRLVSDWAAMPSAAQADVQFSPFLGDGAGTGAADFYALWAEVLPDLVTAFRDFSDDFSDDFS